MKNLLKKNPVAAYYILAFGWTWAIVFLLIVSGQAQDINNPTPFFVLGGIISNISPSIAAYIVTSITEGKAGTRKLRAAFTAKSRIKWYVMAAVTVPAITALTTFLSNHLIRPYQFTVTVPLIIMGLVWPLFSSTGEEFGWRGYILPRLLVKHKPLKAAVILGVIWTVWHLPMYYFGYKDFGSYMVPAFLIVGFCNLILQSVLMTFIYIKSMGSIKLMVLYHYTITASSILTAAFFKAEAAARFTVYEGILSVALFAILASILYVKNRNHLVRGKEGVQC